MLSISQELLFSEKDMIAPGFDEFIRHLDLGKEWAIYGIDDIIFVALLAPLPFSKFPSF